MRFWTTFKITIVLSDHSIKAIPEKQGNFYRNQLTLRSLFGLYENRNFDQKIKKKSAQNDRFDFFKIIKEIFFIVLI